ncbi:uncharacterized protein LOC106011920 [Aplysia californica]|uniref:Uncharacterized protein LOC106011920 n=1 Tax=Aplysia californica TaxID=6500 RepID=A0ABM1A0Y5_APLCA|nr:uncharacterized protein LOC106011920 [Aplysia californica]
MRADDLPKLHALLAENQWNMEMDYLSCVFSADPSGLLVVEDEEENIIGHNGILSHGDHVASSGMNIVKDGYRELGIGRQLFRRVMEVMRERNVGGTALSNRITFYEQFGWIYPSFTLHYNQGKVNPEFTARPATGDFEVTSLVNVSFEDVLNYDAGIHTVPRRRFVCVMCVCVFVRAQLPFRLCFPSELISRLNALDSSMAGVKIHVIFFSVVFLRSSVYLALMFPLSIFLSVL